MCIEFNDGVMELRKELSSIDNDFLDRRRWARGDEQFGFW
jgi:hypothetical protein